MAAGDGYPKLRRGFRDLLFERWYATLVTTKYLAGAYTSRDHRGDPNSRPPFVAVSAARQREALAFIADAGLGENLYRFRPRSEEHTSELQSLTNLVCRLLLEKKKKNN